MGRAVLCLPGSESRLTDELFPPWKGTSEGQDSVSVGPATWKKPFLGEKLLPLTPLVQSSSSDATGKTNIISILTLTTHHITTETLLCRKAGNVGNLMFE